MHIVLRHDLSTMTATVSALTIEEATRNLPRTKYDATEAEERTSSQYKFSFKQFLRIAQPSHLTVLVSIVFLSFVLFPKEPRLATETSTFISFVYLGSFAFHFGAQMWMTFISGIVLFFTIPRHVFGLVQRQLFPKYFLINSILGFLTLTSFLHQHPTQELSIQEKKQVWALTLCFFSELLTKLYLVPAMLTVLQMRMSMEVKAGVGSEIGRHASGKLGNSSQYIKLNRHFRRLHSISEVANMFALACNGFHLYHLATKFCKL